MKVYFPIVKLYIRYLLKACFGLFSLSLAESWSTMHFHLTLLLFFQMSLHDAMQRLCQEAIQGIFTTGPFTIGFFYICYFFDVGPTRKLSPFKTKVMQGIYEQSGPRRRTYM